MKEKYYQRIRAAVIIVSGIAAIGLTSEALAEENVTSRYETDFYYQNVGYKILSESDRTVAVTQEYDIDFTGGYAPSYDPAPTGSGISGNGFLMSNGLFGSVVEIPQTVYDEEGTPYTVTELAYQAINYVNIGTLVLPPTLKSLNNGIISAMGMSTLYLPSGLGEIDGIMHCEALSSLYIPWSVESVKDYSLSGCGLREAYLPPAVRTLGCNVLSRCDSLQTAMLSGVETMGDACFSDCASFWWANLPETLRSMGDGCFNNCPGLERISLPWSRIEMNGCFNGCPSVRCIEMLATEPYPFPENCFNDVDRSKCDLLVPEESVDKYMAADGWKDFYRINGIPTSGSSAAKAVSDSADFVAAGGKDSVRIMNPSGMSLEVTALNGEKVAGVTAAGDYEISLPSGVYIVSSASGSRKVSVR